MPRTESHSPNYGGKRPRGRPRDVTLLAQANRRDQLTDEETEAWLATDKALFALHKITRVLEVQYQKACRGDNDSAKLYLGYGLGPPVQKVAHAVRTYSIAEEIKASVPGIELDVVTSMQLPKDT